MPTPSQAAWSVAHWLTAPFIKPAGNSNMILQQSNNQTMSQLRRFS